MRPAAALVAAVMMLASCRQQAQQAPTNAAVLAPLATRAPVPAKPLAPAIRTSTGTAVEEKGPEGAQAVLRAWGKALEARDYDAAYALWGADAHARSGMDTTEHRQWWARFKTINLAAREGQMEGAAGSSFYTAPVAIVGKLRNGTPYRLEGTVTLRRVNDVPGASADQLRWHIEKVDLKPVS